MVLSMDQYAALRREFLNTAKLHLSPADLIYLKSYYETVINSVRESDYIEDIEDLIKILEKRGLIRYDNIAPLKHIAQLYLKHVNIVDKLDHYNAWMKSFRYPYPPQTNVYQLRHGECCLSNKISNDLPSYSNSNHDIHSSSSYKFPCVLPPGVVIDDDLSDCNNSVVSLSLHINPCSAVISSINNFGSNSDRNNDDKRIKDCKARVISHETYKISENQEDNVASELLLPSDLTFETDINDKPTESKHLSTEDFDITDKALGNKPLLSTPLSVQPETNICSSTSPCHSLNRFSSKDNVQIARNRFNRFITRRFIRIILISSSFAIIFTYLLIAFGFSKNSVNYNPEPSAPSFQEAHTAHPATSSNPGIVYGSQLNQNGNPGYNVPQHSTGPLQILSEREAKLQTKVFEKVSKKLGKYWADMARYLDIRECDINNIDNQYPNYHEKAYAALKMFAEETDLDYWQRTLKKALEKARRPDLKEDVEELASRKF